MLTTVDARNVRVFPFLGFQNLAVQEPDPCISKHVAAHVPFHGENPKASNNLNCTAVDEGFHVAVIISLDKFPRNLKSWEVLGAAGNRP